MANRYEKMYELDKKQYFTGSPLILEAGQLLRDNQTMSLLVQLKFSSVAEQTIRAIIIRVIGYDALNQQLGSKEFQYLDLDVKKSATCCDRTPIPLKNNTVRRIEVLVERVVFADFTQWMNTEKTAFGYMPAAADISEKHEQPETAADTQNTADSPVQIMETKYLQATALKNAGKYAEARAIFATIAGYRDVDQLIKACEPAVPASDAVSANHAAHQNAGGFITFGHYPQTASEADSTDIEWLVLEQDRANNRMLLISRYGLDARPYHTGQTATSWEACALRAWLNNDFYQHAFSKTEQNAILLTNVDNSAGQCYGDWKTSGGNNTQDKIFLLSCVEANKYFCVDYLETDKAKGHANQASRVQPTAYANAHGALVNGMYQTQEGAPAGWWWLRSPGSYPSFAACVYPSGSLYSSMVSSGREAVRPAMWVNLEPGDAVTVFEASNGHRDAPPQTASSNSAIQERDYQVTLKLQNEGKYEEATAVFETSNGHRDAAPQTPNSNSSIQEQAYQAALELMDNGRYGEAVAAFRALNGYKDSAEQITNCNAIRERDYQAALRLKNEGKFEEAIAAFEALNGYGYSATKIADCKAALQQASDGYQAALKLKNDGKYEEAITAFEALNGYSDSAAQIKETKYLQATALNKAGKYAEAYMIFATMTGYKDVDKIIKEDDNISAAAAAAAAATTVRIAPYKNVGGYVTFGHYPQTKAGTDNTEIEWLVLAYDSATNHSLLISRYGLDVKAYNTEKAGVTWEACTLRTWLNDEFYNKAFSKSEQSAILTTPVDNSESQCYSGWDTSGGNNTQDKIFLLSYAEANKYFGVRHYSVSGAKNNVKSRIQPTAYAIAQGAYKSSSYTTSDGAATGYWWLRSPGRNQNGAAGVGTDGSLGNDGVGDSRGAVRPALWVNLESGIF